MPLFSTNIPPLCFNCLNSDQSPEGSDKNSRPHYWLTVWISQGSLNISWVFMLASIFSVSYSVNVYQTSLPQWSSGKESTLQCRGHRLDTCFWKIPHAVGQLSLWARITESMNCDHWSLWVYSLCSATREVPTRRSQRTTAREAPLLTLTTTREKPACSSEAPVQPKVKFKTQTFGKKINVLSRLENVGQDGGVEGCVLISSGKSTKIATSCWTTIDRKMLEPTKKNTPHVQRQRRSHSETVGGVQTQNPNPFPPGEWPTHWRTIKPEKFSHCCEGSELHVRLPSLGIWQELGIPRESALEGQWDLITGLPED